GDALFPAAQPSRLSADARAGDAAVERLAPAAERPPRPPGERRRRDRGHRGPHGLGRRTFRDGRTVSYCDVAPGHPFHGPYHDLEYGFPVADDDALFERL